MGSLISFQSRLNSRWNRKANRTSIKLRQIHKQKTKQSKKTKEKQKQKTTTTTKQQQQ